MRDAQQGVLGTLPYNGTAAADEVMRVAWRQNLRSTKNGANEELTAVVFVPKRGRPSHVRAQSVG